jgi:hypothetical protein
VRERTSGVSQQCRRGDRRKESGCAVNTWRRARASRRVIRARFRQERPDKEGDGESGREGEECSELKWTKVRKKSSSGVHVLVMVVGWWKRRGSVEQTGTSCLRRKVMEGACALMARVRVEHAEARDDNGPRTE